MQRMKKRFWEDMKWGTRHHTQLLKKYKDMWVAVFKKKVVAAGKNLELVEREAEKKLETKEFPVLFIDSAAHIYEIKN